MLQHLITAGGFFLNFIHPTTSASYPIKITVYKAPLLLNSWHLLDSVCDITYQKRHIPLFPCLFDFIAFWEVFKKILLSSFKDNLFLTQQYVSIAFEQGFSTSGTGTKSGWYRYQVLSGGTCGTPGTLPWGTKTRNVTQLTVVGGLACITQCRKQAHHSHVGPPPMQWVVNTGWWVWGCTIALPCWFLAIPCDRTEIFQRGLFHCILLFNYTSNCTIMYKYNYIQKILYFVVMPI